MGLYNTFGKEAVQLKVGKREMKHFHIGQSVIGMDIEDGIYLAYEGAVVIRDQVVQLVTDKVFTKWGDAINLKKLMDLGNPVTRVIKKMSKRRVEDGKRKSRKKN